MTWPRPGGTTIIFILHKRNLEFWHLPRVNTSHKVRQGDLSAGGQALEQSPPPRWSRRPPSPSLRLEEKWEGHFDHDPEPPLPPSDSLGESWKAAPPPLDFNTGLAIELSGPSSSDVCLFDACSLSICSVSRAWGDSRQTDRNGPWALGVSIWAWG